ncbi:MAG: PGPGW domain-containing protein [bacterium]
MLDGLTLSREWMVGLVIASLVTLIASPLVLAAVLAWMPADYFRNDPAPPSSFAGRHPAVRIAFHVAKNVVGTLLFAAGVVMLVTPGQGVLTILAGLLLLDLPGKRVVELRIVRNPHVLRAVNKLRARAHHPPLELPPED